MNSKTSKKQGRAQSSGRLTGAIKSAAPRGMLPSSLRGLASALLCGAILLIIASAIVYSTADPNRYVIPAGLSVLYISCFIGGLVATRANRGAPLICGLLTGAFTLIVLFAASLLLDPSLSAGHGIALAVGLRGIAVVFSVLGAFAGSGTKKRKKPTRKK